MTPWQVVSGTMQKNGQEMYNITDNWIVEILFAQSLIKQRKAFLVPLALETNIARDTY